MQALKTVEAGSLGGQAGSCLRCASCEHQTDRQIDRPRWLAARSGGELLLKTVVAHKEGNPYGAMEHFGAGLR
jgi:hypothetical protein